MARMEVEAPRRTKIVATLGPATDGEGVLRALLAAGVDIVRCNFSHGTPEQHAARIARVRTEAARLGRTVAVLQDLQGPKIRTGRLAGGGPVRLADGAAITITTEEVLGDAARVSTSYQDLPRDVRPGDRILLDDGRLELRVEAVEAREVHCRVVRGGELGERKGINLPGVPVSAPALTPKDRADLEFGLGQGVDFVALSFVRRAADAREAREVIAASGQEVPLIAKIEKPEALDDLGAVIAAFEGVMVARGDLGVELAPEKVPLAQKAIIRAANRAGKPVITATQMLESMTQRPYPTRAEASDVANAILDGTDACMLSGETAVGRYPVEAVRTIDSIAREVEQHGVPTPTTPGRDGDLARAVCHAAVDLAREARARAIVCFTRSGRTAQLVSQLRPALPILAFAADERVARRLALWWGVVPFRTALPPGADATVSLLDRELVQAGLLRHGDRIVVLGAALGERQTNLISLHHVR